MKMMFDAPQLDGATRALLERVANCCEAAEGVSGAGFGFQITDDEGIRALNLAQRGVDAATDVLSFPTVRYPGGKTAGACPKRLRAEFDADMNACNLGDIVISLPRARAQADEFGHGEARELCYLTAHGIFHLLGYDHMNEEERAVMRNMEEKALHDACVPRVTDEELLDRARQALQNAYAPYSKFRVGACILSRDGRVFTGCNIENASYGLSICAERCAAFAAVSAGAMRFERVAIAAEKAMPWPCGACRQVLREFAAPETRVLVTCGSQVSEMTLAELMPHSLGEDEGTTEFLGKD